MVQNSVHWQKITPTIIIHYHEFLIHVHQPISIKAACDVLSVAQVVTYDLVLEAALTAYSISR